MNRGQTVYRLLGLALLLVLCGCAGRSGSSVQAETASPAPTLAATPTPAPTLAATPTHTPTPAPTPFSIAWISDTQHLIWPLELRPYYDGMMGWIADNKDVYNIVYTVHTGDIVEDGTYGKLWETASSSFAALQESVPLFFIAGNHDMGRVPGWTPLYYSQDFVMSYPAERRYRQGDGFYELFSAGGRDFVLAGLCWGANDADGRQWIKEVLDQYPDRVGIVVAHCFLSKDGVVDRNRGIYIEEEIVRPCKNVRLVLCGHDYSVQNLELSYDDGGSARTVEAMMFDMQGKENKWGQVRLLTFDPADRSITARTYEYQTDSWLEDENNSFVLENAW